MTVNPSGWRPSTPANEAGETETVTGNRALMLEEPLIFEIGSTEANRRRFRFTPRRPGPRAMRKQRLTRSWTSACAGAQAGRPRTQP